MRYNFTLMSQWRHVPFTIRKWRRLISDLPADLLPDLQLDLQLPTLLPSRFPYRLLGKTHIHSPIGMRTVYGHLSTFCQIFLLLSPRIRIFRSFGKCRLIARNLFTWLQLFPFEFRLQSHVKSTKQKFSGLNLWQGQYSQHTLLAEILELFQHIYGNFCFQKNLSFNLDEI